MLLVQEGPAGNRKSTTMHYSLHFGHMFQLLKTPVQYISSKKEAEGREGKTEKTLQKLNLALAHRGISAAMPVRGGGDAAQNLVQPRPGQVKRG